VSVVDDEPKGRTFLCGIPAHERYRPQAFDSGTTALEVVLLDIYLPDLMLQIHANDRGCI
jgi:hypothetical protein